MTEFDKPFTTNGLGKMRDWCDKVGLFHCTTHGLRKAGATTYTKKARGKKMAASAMHKLVPEQK